MRCNGILGGNVVRIILLEASIWKSRGPRNMPHCVKHNQHAYHANARGFGGMPQEKFEK